MEHHLVDAFQLTLGLMVVDHAFGFHKNKS